MAYPSAIDQNASPGQTVYPPGATQAPGPLTGAPSGGIANPTLGTWLSNVAASLVGVETQLGLPSAPAAGSALAQTANILEPTIYIWDDFSLNDSWIGSEPTGNYPGKWVAGSNTSLANPPSGSPPGVMTFPGANSNLVQNIVGTPGSYIYPLYYSQCSKIVFRAVFSVNNISSLGSTGEYVLGFTSSGTNVAGADNNLYGALINFCPGYGGQLPDWNTRTALTSGQLTGITWGVYNGSVSSYAGFGYKPSTIITTLAINTWYEAIISMIPGVSVNCYVATYGSAPALDVTCSVTSQVPTSTTRGPVACLVNGSGSSSCTMYVDKCEYAVFATEGIKQYGPGTLNGY
jgi:hypothetical protein